MFKILNFKEAIESLLCFYAKEDFILLNLIHEFSGSESFNDS